MACATSLAAPAPIAEERKVVTTLICDLVGFTALCEGADSEDVDALLRRYNALARRIVESHGGVVEKFVGDAVVAAFGVPAVHEDDPDRAVRAGLRIIEEVGRLRGVGERPVEVRIGVSTGEAFVRLDVKPGSGEGFLTGDAVNVAARLQAAAPPMGVVVGELTHTLTEKAVVYEALEPVSAKGKSEPLAVWRARAARAAADVERAGETTPLVGRRVELSFLEALLDKAAESASPQIALIVGEPGIGKSRLVAELLTTTGSRVVTWRQGRCLPYGEGVAFWALGEIVRAHAGVLETDDRATVEAKLDAVLPAGEDRDWLRQRVRALIGLEAPQASREENYTAWLRVLEEIAGTEPTVFVIEDLHWADEALLGFLEYVASHAADVPLLLIVTARPELFERQPTFGATGRVNRVVLEPLSERETEALVASLLAEMADDVRTTIARRAEGNPFYAEESARLVRDSVRAGAPADWASTGAPVSGSVQAVIAARLDALPPELKAVLCDASVVGEVFWDGALAAIGGRERHQVEEMMDELMARQLVHRVRTSSMAGEREYAFGHALARDVAYGELPRTARARKHAAAAAWIDGKTGDHVEERADLLAHHYATAVELGRSAGQAEVADPLVQPAARYLTLAGDRAMNIDIGAAERHYARVLRIVPADDATRPTALAKWAGSLLQQLRYDECASAYQEAVDGFRKAGHVRAAAAAQMAFADALSVIDSSSDRPRKTALEALTVLEADGPSPELAEALGDWAGWRWGQGEQQLALEAAERAVALARRLRLPVPIRALVYRGAARCALGDGGGLDDLSHALGAAKEAGLGDQANEAFWALGVNLGVYRGAQASLKTLREALAFAERRGMAAWAAQHRGDLVWPLMCAGEWDAGLAEAESYQAARLEEVSDLWELIFARVWQTLVLAARGEVGAAEPLATWLESKTREDVGHIELGCRIAAAAARLAQGDGAAAVRLLTGCEAALGRPGGMYWTNEVPTAVRTALAAGDAALAARLSDAVTPRSPTNVVAAGVCRALVDESAGRTAEAAAGFADAASAWHEFSIPYEEAQALLGHGRCLVALGRALEAAPPLRTAHEILARLGARPALEDTETLMMRLAR